MVSLSFAEFLITAGAALVVVFVSIVLLLGGVAVLGGSAWIWGYAIAAVHRARVHGHQADANEQVFQETKDALEHAPRPRHSRFVPEYEKPSEEDLREFVMSERVSTNGEQKDEFDTTTNEGFEITPPIRHGSMYNVPEPEE